MGLSGGGKDKQAKNGVANGCLPPQKTLFNVPMKWVSLVALTFQTSWQVFVIKYARASGTKYLNTVVVLLSEILKVVLSFLLITLEEGSLSKSFNVVIGSYRRERLEALKLGVPAIAYAIQNNLIFYSLDKLNAAVQQVTYQLKILTAAALGVALLGKSLGLTKWMSLLLLVVGVSVVQWPKDADLSTDVANAEIHSGAIMGLLAVLVACFVSGFAGVYIEKLLKQSTSSVWVRNFQLGIFGAIVAFGGAMAQDGQQILHAGLFQGFNWRVVLAVFTHASGGLLVAVVLKFADNILRQFSTAISIVITSAGSALVLRDFSPDLKFVTGAFFTVLATFMYNLGIPDLSHRNGKTAK